MYYLKEIILKQQNHAKSTSVCKIKLAFIGFAYLMYVQQTSREEYASWGKKKGMQLEKISGKIGETRVD